MTRLCVSSLVDILHTASDHSHTHSLDREITAAKVYFNGGKVWIFGDKT